MVRGCGTGIEGIDHQMKEMHTKVHLKQVASSEDELTSSADDSLNIQGPLLLKLLDGGRKGIEILVL